MNGPSKSHESPQSDGGNCERLLSKYISCVEKGDSVQAQSTYAELYELLAVRIRSFLSRRGIQHADIEECVQDISMKILKDRPAIMEGKFDAWLATVVRHYMSDCWRKKAKERRCSAIIGEKLLIDSGAKMDVQEEEKIEEELEQKNLDYINAAILLQAINIRDRVVVLGILTDVPVKTLAEQIGLSEWGIYKIYSRALQKIGCAANMPIKKDRESPKVSKEDPAKLLQALKQLPFTERIVICGMLSNKSETTLSEELHVTPSQIVEINYHGLKQLSALLAA
ncbi:MAG: sigma-70 family RNA polymerase sigma factor [Candidatus Peribacteraceae bacterium]|nr:sigma-70 family RNA polymerase sigma factor [Candidatus Peribacteraceae bacterium]